jgi:hypothetical protein
MAVLGSLIAKSGRLLLSKIKVILIWYTGDPSTFLGTRLVEKMVATP